MAWTALNSGLSGSALNVNYMARRPNHELVSVINQELLIATDAGVFVKRPGTMSWAQLTLPDPSNAEFSDTPAATVDELTFHWVAYNPVTGDWHVLAAKVSFSRIWLYLSADSGESWTSRGVMTV